MTRKSVDSESEKQKSSENNHSDRSSSASHITGNNRCRSRVALFGGTFDPVHIGHLRLLIEIQEFFQFDQIRVIPCRPAMKKPPIGSDNERLSLLELALAELPFSNIVVDKRELMKDNPSRTAETLEAIRFELGKQISLTFIMGMDAFEMFEQWHAPEKIRSLANLLVTDRPGSTPLSNEGGAEAHDSLQNTLEGSYQIAGGQIFFPTTLLPISSSQIRRDIELGRCIQYLLPRSVIKYIETHGLYKSPQNEQN